VCVLFCVLSVGVDVGRGAGCQFVVLEVYACGCECGCGYQCGRRIYE